MNTTIHRILVEKKSDYAIEAKQIFNDLKITLSLPNLDSIRIINRYDVSGADDQILKEALFTIFAEPALDNLYHEDFPLAPDETAFAVEYLPGQFDQRADSAAQCLQIISQKDLPLCKYAKIIVLKGNLKKEDLDKIKSYCINPVDSREADMTKPASLEIATTTPPPVAILDGFINYNDSQLEQFYLQMGLAMSMDDLYFVRDYFKCQEKRDPTVTEIKVIDTYWSDHCRHTTFSTKITDITFDEGHFNTAIKNSYEKYLASRSDYYKEKEKPITLMDIATLAAKEMRAKGLLDDLDISEEINACSIKVELEIDGKKEPWLLMFKNETHNHPTEIEPFGGAATCLGGAIRDPLSGRSYVYQAMRLTGSGDPRKKIEDTLPGKLPQRKITKEAARGYSSYGNQIGLATGQVAEVYDEAFIAKRMEVGAVIAAAPAENIRRATPKKGDIVILIGGRTGRDGCGGATGSSKEHDEKSLMMCGAEVQKGNAPTERKLQRLFRNPSASKLIKKCNDFGAGGVSVAIGELTDGLEIDLDAIPKKYAGLDGTELAISESQERMAVVLAPEDADTFISLAKEENLEATIVARVTDSNRLKMTWQNTTIVDICRDFLNTNGVEQQITVKVMSPEQDENYFLTVPDYVDENDLRKSWLDNLKQLNHAGQKGLVEQFDSTVGANTVLFPFGGKNQLTPAVGMAAKFPVLNGQSSSASLMTYGYNPRLAKWSPYHGAIYAVVDSIAKIVAMGGSADSIRLSLQEYFEKLGQDPFKWGKPFSALLGAFEAQTAMAAPAIGGKDSMSGSFKDLHVPPTLISFAVSTVKDCHKIVSPEFKKAGSYVLMVPLICNIYEVPDFKALKEAYQLVHQLIQQGLILSVQTIDQSGIAGAVSKMCFGNNIGITFEEEWDTTQLFMPDIGSLLIELDHSIKAEEVPQLFGNVVYQYIGKTRPEPAIYINDDIINIKDCVEAWMEPLESVFPSHYQTETPQLTVKDYTSGPVIRASHKIAKPKVLIPVFPGTNCEYDIAKAFSEAGGLPQTLVFKNLSPTDIEESITALVKAIAQSQIIAFPGGFSAGDEPEGSGKFIAAIFRNPRIKEAVAAHLEENDGLILGICNGFQALIKLGLVPYGEIRNIEPTSPTLTFNTIGRHISSIVRTKIVSNLSPWVSCCDLNEIYHIAISHGEGRFVAPPEEIEKLLAAGQVVTKYVDYNGNPSMEYLHNPNGSNYAIEGITSPDGRVLGKMAHSERMWPDTVKNIPGEKIQPIFKSGINYFK
ncbi:MAG: phosphoribosylformylglycinamidine synthase [Bacillota bacterium]|jgi:phosphoribosylformylglycinamidine synthase